MADSNPTSTKDSATNIDATLQAVASDADSRSATAVSKFTLIHQARLSNQTRAATLAVALYGADSSQAIAAQKDVTATITTAARLAALTQQANTPAPTVPAAGWVLHGRIYATDLTPQSHYAVFLVDAQKNYLSDYGYSYTDDTGYFLITYPGPSTAPAEPGESQSADAQPTNPQPTPTSQLYLQITDDKANPVLLSETAFVPVTGRATYQTVTLPPGGTKLGDLPVDIRAVAFPNLKP